MSTDVKRYYAVLGVDPAASDKVIRSAFRRRAKELHPDAQSGNATAFILLKRAYDTLSDPEHRAAYDRACEPPPRPVAAEPLRPRSYRPMPMPPRPPTSRLGGVGVARYIIAFIVMAAISIGGVQAMISLTQAPPSIQTRAATQVDDRPAAETSTAAPGSSKSGFWDPSPNTGDKRP